MYHITYIGIYKLELITFYTFQLIIEVDKNKKRIMKPQNPPQNFLKKKCITYLGGPILFTAPHSKRLNRGGPKYDQKLRIHQRQLYTAWISSQLATLTFLTKKTEPNSFVVWGKSVAIDDKDIDPNYLLEDMLPDSQFHQSLHAWAIKNHGKPLLHVDIHGKLNREKNCEVDVGIQSMIAYWGNDPLIKEFKPFFQTKLSKIFQGMKFRQFKCVFNTDPYLHGYWGGKMMTMTEQAIALGIPSFQLQIPREVRKALFKNPDLMAKFADGIKQFYVKIVTPYFKQRKRQMKISKEIAAKFEITVNNLKQLEQAQTQIQKMQQKYQLNVNAKKI